MEKEILKNKILEVMKKYPVGSVATIKEGTPWVRYMSTQPQEDLTILTTTHLCSRKIEQIKENNNVHITFGFDPANWMTPYLNVVARAEILTDMETKKKCWMDMFDKFYGSPDNPDYCVIKITPESIEYVDSTMETHTYTV